MKKYTIQMIYTDNHSNGNPRRLYLVECPVAAPPSRLLVRVADRQVFVENFDGRHCIPESILASAFDFDLTSICVDVRQWNKLKKIGKNET